MLLYEIIERLTLTEAIVVLTMFVDEVITKVL